MAAPSRLMIGKLLPSLIAVFTIVSPFLADWNATYIYNPMWPPHAKFHNAQTMSMAVLLGLSSLLFLWRTRASVGELAAGAMFASLYWLSQLPAFLFPGVGWTDPNLLEAGQSMGDMPIQLKGDIVLFAIIALACWLMFAGRRATASA